MAAQVGPCDEADRAGRSAQAEYDRRYAAWRSSRVQASLRAFPAALVFALLGAWYLTATTGFWLFGVAFAALVLGAVADVVLRSPQDLRELRQVAAGERATGRLLARAQRDGYLVLHDRMTSGQVDVEHLLIGPPGMFVLDSRNWATVKAPARVQSGRLWIDRDSQADLLERVRRQAAEVAREVAAGLDPPVTSGSLNSGSLNSGPLVAGPVVVVHGKRVSGTPRLVDGVAVVEASQLMLYLSRSEPIWAPEQIRRVATVAERALRVKDR